ncbi:MAG: hypothetical protein JSS25_05000 [Proteobacteria bacterium]|nr:hypothetical protein [Pseudomonadota bacterium]
MNLTINNPCIDPGVVIDSANGNTRIVHKPDTREYFRLGIREAGFLESLDGSRNPELLSRENGFEFNYDEVEYLLAWFAEKRLLAGLPTPINLVKKSALSRVAGFVADTRKWRFKLGSPNRFLDNHLNVVNALFSVPALAIYLGLIFLPIAVLIVSPTTVSRAMTGFNPAMSGWNWLGLYVGLLAMNVLHEMAHAIACKHFGGKVEKIGLMLMYFQPVMYCDVSDSWRFREVGEKVTVAAAGIALQLILAALTAVVFLFFGGSVLLIFATINLVLAVYNLFPFVKLDGYWILVHLLDEPQLQQKGLKSVDLKFRKLVGRSLGKSTPYRRAVTVFGVGHVLAVPAFWALGMFGAYRYLAKLSSTLAIVVVTLFALPLICRAVTKGITYLRSVFYQMDSVQ